MHWVNPEPSTKLKVKISDKRSSQCPVVDQALSVCAIENQTFSQIFIGAYSWTKPLYKFVLEPITEFVVNQKWNIYPPSSEFVVNQN